MALNASGPISLAGTTAGQSIQVELGGNGTTQVSLNDTAVRTLAGVATGAIVMPTNFYGKSFFTGPTTGIYYSGYTITGASSNIATRINACGALIGSETAISNARYYGGAAPVGSNLLYWGGVLTGCGSVRTRTLRINTSGAIVGTATDVTIGGYGMAGSKSSSGVVGTYFGRNVCGCCAYSNTNTLTRINACGVKLTQNTNLVGATAKEFHAGALVGTNSMFYAGNSGGCCYIIGRNNSVIRVNNCGALVGVQTTAGTARFGPGGAPVGSNGVFYGGLSASCVASNLTTRINACGALVGSQTTAGTARWGTGGANVGSNGVFYAGATWMAGNAALNLVTRINACGALVGSQTNIGTARQMLAGGGL